MVTIQPDPQTSRRFPRPEFATDVFFLAAIKNYSDWPEECKRLSVEIRVKWKEKPVRAHMY